MTSDPVTQSGNDIDGGILASSLNRLSIQEECTVHDLPVETRGKPNTVNDEISRTQSPSETLRAEEEPLATQIETLSAAVAPNKRLPFEVLANIFLHCLPDDFRVTIPSPCPDQGNFLPWKLGHVCSWWRYIVLEERRLWNCISLRDTCPNMNEILRPMADTVLSRSGQSVLNFSACFIMKGRGLRHSEFPPIQTFVRPYMHRFTTLTLVLIPRWTCEFLALSPGMLPILRECCIVVSSLTLRWEMPDEGALVFRGAPRLLNFEMTPHAGNPDNFLPRMNLPWSQLSRISFPFISFALQEIYDVFCQCSSLVSCQITIKENSLFQGSSLEPIILPHLEDFTLFVVLGEKESDLLRLLILPSLSAFTYASHSQASTRPVQLPALFQRSACHLTHLAIPNGPKYTDLGPILEHTPALLHLSAEKSCLAPSTMDLFACGAYAPKLKSLKCRIMNQDEDPCLQMLKEHWKRCRSSTDDGQDPPYRGIGNVKFYIVGASSRSGGSFNDRVNAFRPDTASVKVEVVY